MLDSYIRPLIDPPLNFLGRRLGQLGVSSHMITLIGFVAGLVSMMCIVLHKYPEATFFLVFNRLMDGVDGAVARHTKLSDIGGFFDIVADFIIYSGIVFAFGYAHAEQALYAAFLIFSFVGPITSFLAYAIMASNRQINTNKRGVKSFYHMGGICEGTETFIALLLICLVPSYFREICLIYGTLCWITTAGRVYRAWVDFG